MRIPEADHTPRISPATGAPPPPALPASSVQTPATTISIPASLLQHLSSLLSELGLNTTPAQREDLAGQFVALGFSSAELDRKDALRAIFLSRNSVPLTAALLKTPFSPESPILFRQAAVLLEEALTLLDGRSLPVEVRTAIATLARDLEALLGGSAPVSGWLAGIIRDKREESLNSIATVWEEQGGSAADGDDFGSILRKNGMAFEWRLLGWYRAGRDPIMLRDLLHGDLKGVLFNFLGNSEKSPDRATGAEKLEARVRSLIDRITANQVAHLLDGSGERRTLPLVVPSEEPREWMYAGVRTEGRKRRDGDAPETELFSLSLDVETTRLGPVRAQLRFSGKTASVTFLLKDRRTLALAGGMEDEFRGMLRERGYEPGVIRFALASREEAYSAGSSDPRNSLDIQG